MQKTSEQRPNPDQATSFMDHLKVRETSKTLPQPLQSIKEALLGFLNKNNNDKELARIAEEVSLDENRFLYYDQWQKFVLDRRMYDDAKNLYDLPLERIAHHMYSIGDYTTYSLREERVDANGDPYLICADEQSDAEVIGNADRNDRETASALAIARTLDDACNVDEQSYSFHRAHDAENFYIAASACLIIVAGMSQAKAHFHIMEAFREKGLSFKVEQVHWVRIATMLKIFQNFIQRTPLTEKKPYRDFTDAIAEGISFEINSDKLESPAVSGNFLDQASAQMLKPLFESNHKSRLAMIDAAKEFAKKYLIVDQDRLERSYPPEWFWEEIGNGHNILSREIIMYMAEPRLDANSGQSGETFSFAGAEKVFNQQPKILTIIAEEFDSPRIYSGWYFIRFSDQYDINEHPLIISSSPLH